MTELKCKGCLKRKVGCHATCESYLAWKKEHDELKEKQREVADGMKNMYSSAINGAVKILSDEISDLQDDQNKATEGYKKKKMYLKEKLILNSKIEILLV